MPHALLPPSPPPRTFLEARAWLRQIGGASFVTADPYGRASVIVGTLGRSCSIDDLAPTRTSLERAFLDAVWSLYESL